MYHWSNNIYVLNKSNHRQLILVFTIIFQGESFFVYLFSNNIYILLGTRTFTAIMKTFTSIYMPVWIDQFGIRQYKTILFTLVYMTNPYGQVIGFAIGTVLFPNDWVFSLFCIGCILIIFGLLFFIFPNKYFSSKYMFIGYGENEHKREKLVATKQIRTSVFGHYSKLHNSLKNKISNGPQKQYMNSSNASNPNQQTKSLFFLLFSPSFMLSSLTRANMFFIFQIIHLFIKDFVINGLKISNETMLLYYYSTISITGPALGSFIGGLLSNKLGGYESHKSIFVCIIFGIWNLLSLIPFSLAENLELFSTGLFLFFFRCSAILPTIAGYTITSTPRELKGVGTALDILLTTFLGKLLSPIVYGIVNDYMKEIDPKFAWRISLYYYIVGFILMMMTCWAKWKNAKDNEKIPSGRRKRDIIAKTGKYLNEFGSGDKVELIKVYKPKPA